MTVIAAWWTPREGAIAADDAYQYGGHGAMQVSAGSSKIRRVGTTLIGFTGACAFSEWWRAIEDLSDIEQVRKHNTAFRSWARSEGHGQVIEALWSLDFAALLVMPSGIWTINTDGGIHQIREPYAAIGSGRDQAIGALWVLTTHRQTPESKARLAVEASIAHAVGIGGPAHSLAQTWAP